MIIYNQMTPKSNAARSRRDFRPLTEPRPQRCFRPPRDEFSGDLPRRERAADALKRTAKMGAGRAIAKGWTRPEAGAVCDETGIADLQIGDQAIS